jgi:hypothetical protein
MRLTLDSKIPRELMQLPKPRALELVEAGRF